jgi:hypothetical protein
VKSDTMSFASGSTKSSSNVESFNVLGDVGIVGRDMDAADTFTNGSRLVSGAISWSGSSTQEIFAVYILWEGLGV